MMAEQKERARESTRGMGGWGRAKRNEDLFKSASGEGGGNKQRRGAAVEKEERRRMEEEREDDRKWCSDSFCV